MVHPKRQGVMAGVTTIAFATYRGQPGLSEDDRDAEAALRRRGVAVEAAVWDGDVEWRRYDAVIVRTCWDYHLRSRAFLDWVETLEQAAVPLWNPARILRWNLDKSYLKALSVRGIPIAPTVFLSQGAPENLGHILEREGFAEAVVKPSISASGFETFRTSPERAALDQAQFEQGLGRGGVLIQRFMPEISDRGEWSLLFFAGEYSHAVVKLPRAGEFRAQAEYGGSVTPKEPPPSLIAAASDVLRSVEEPWLYARVDGIEIGGALLVMELEMIEPGLFLKSDPGAADRFAEAICRVLR
jgi:glutathione synthase/RimK-type ligase-like ATP-grasp enzyme